MGAFHDAVNEQIGHEFAASQQYIAIAVWFDAETLPNLAAHFYRQAVEERNHAMMLVQFLLDADRPVTIPAVSAPRPGEARHRTDRRPAEAGPGGGRLRRRGGDALVPEGAA
jgi:ferritin